MLQHITKYEIKQYLNIERVREAKKKIKFFTLAIAKKNKITPIICHRLNL